MQPSCMGKGTMYGAALLLASMYLFYTHTSPAPDQFPITSATLKWPKLQRPAPQDKRVAASNLAAEVFNGQTCPSNWSSIFLLHVPKTGGTALRKFLVRNLKHQNGRGWCGQPHELFPYNCLGCVSGCQYHLERNLAMQWYAAPPCLAIHIRHCDARLGSFQAPRDAVSVDIKPPITDLTQLLLIYF